MLSTNSDKIYNVQLINEAKGLNTTIEVGNNEYICEAAEAQGIELPVSCHEGACVRCTDKLVEGSVDQDRYFLKPRELDAGFVLTCITHPLSDCVILTTRKTHCLGFNFSQL